MDKHKKLFEAVDFLLRSHNEAVKLLQATMAVVKQHVIIIEALKLKGHFTDDDIKEAIQHLDDIRKKTREANSVQPQGTRTVEVDLGSGEPGVLRDASDGTNQGSSVAEVQKSGVRDVSGEASPSTTLASSSEANSVDESLQTEEEQRSGENNPG